MRQMRRLLFALLLALLFPATSLMAQRLTGSASVQVLDPTGKAVSDAKAVISNSDRGIKLSVTGTSEGVVTVPDLPPGDYKITLQREGFKTTTATLTIRVGVTTSLEISMELGEVSSSVIVEASAQTADTSQSTVQGVIQSTQIESLPLNGRNFLDLAQQAPGIQLVDGGLFDPTKNQMVGVSVGGRSGRSTRIQVDGVDITDESVGTTVMNLSNESIQEFGIQQSSLDPSTDLTSSGAVNIITKSGTNAIHGSGFGLWRRSDFAANNAPTNLVNPAKPPFSRDNYGGQLGGPFLKDKWFWQAEYEKLQQVGANSTNVPQFPQFTGSFGVPVDDRSGGARTDYNLTQNQHLFYRYNHNDNIGVTGFGNKSLSAFANSNSANSHVAGWDYSKGNWVHSIRFSYLKFLNRIVAANDLAGTPPTLGPNGEPVEINITGIGGFLVGPNINAPQSTFQQNRQLKYDGSLIHGKHQFKFGVEYNRIDQNSFASFFANGPLIAAPYAVNGVPTPAAVPFNGNGITDPLNFPFRSVIFGNGLGFGSEKPSLGLPHGGFINDRFGIYAHDTWRVTRTFTVNAGLRYDRDNGLTNHDLARDPLIGVFDPELAGNPRNDNLRLAPKAGFAWDVKGNGKTVIRGGAGIYYETNIFNNILFDRTLNIQPGLGFAGPLISGGGITKLPDPRDAANILFDINASCGGTCIGKSVGSVIPVITAAQQAFKEASAELAAGFPSPGVPVEFESDRGTDTIGGSLIDPHYKSPYGAQFNIGFQRELKRGLVLSVDYVLNRGVHFNMTRDRNRQGAANNFDLAAAQAAIAATLADCGAATINQAIASCAANGGDPADIFNFSGNGLGSGNAFSGAAFPGNNHNFRAMTVIEQVGLSRYQGLQVALTGRLGTWGPFSNTFVNATYALSRFKSTGGAGGIPGATDQDFLTAAQNNDFPTRFYGPSNLDRTHIFGVSFITELPWHFRLASTTAYRSAESSDITLFDDTGADAAAIFRTDLNGDGVVGDPLPGTNHGSFDRGVSAKKLARMVANFDNTIAGGLTPAGQALVDAGLFTVAQLQALGGAIQPVGGVIPGQINNPNFFTSDLRLSWRYRLKERLTIEPIAEVFNVLNRANFAGSGTGNTALSGVLSGASGTINGSDSPPQRIGAGSGSFSTGSPRAFQFGIRVTF
jgi:outer membrane receptor protein involved in Fe transport